jgi:hypothetical protein
VIANRCQQLYQTQELKHKIDEMEKNYKNIGYFILFLIPLTIFGFFKTYFIKFTNFDEHIDFYIHLHAFIAFLWVLLLGIQPILIRNQRYSLHRKLGKITYYLFPLLILSLIPQIINEIQRGDTIYNTVANGILLTTFYVLAIVNKKNTAKHMRYMISLALVFVTPTLGRVIAIWFGAPVNVMYQIVFTGINLILIGLIVWDKTNNQNFRPYLIALTGFILSQIGYTILVQY